MIARVYQAQVFNVLHLLAGFGTATAHSLPPRDFVEPATRTTVRGRVIPAPPESGKVHVPGTVQHQEIRITNANDCRNTDCLVDVGHSYWGTNNHVGSGMIVIFATLFGYNKPTGPATIVGPLFDPSSPFIWATGADGTS